MFVMLFRYENIGNTMTARKKGKGQIGKISYLRSSDKLRMELARALEDKGDSFGKVAKMAKKAGRYIDAGMVSRTLSGQLHGIGDENLFWLCCMYGIIVELKVGRTLSGKMRSVGQADKMTTKVFSPEADALE